MAERAVVEYPDPRLRLTCAPVQEFDAALGRLIDDLIDTMTGAGVIGLSAPQVDVPQRVAVTDAAGDGAAPRVYVNPEILSRGRWGLVEESCLSIPGITGNVLRATQVHVRAQDRHGAAFEDELRDMDAVSLQHEIDHLNGKLFIDRLSVFRRLALRMSGKTKSRSAEMAEGAPA